MTTFLLRKCSSNWTLKWFLLPLTFSAIILHNPFIVTTAQTTTHNSNKSPQFAANQNIQRDKESNNSIKTKLHTLIIQARAIKSNKKGVRIIQTILSSWSPLFEAKLCC